jgi:putative phosphonate metabolism protein
MRYALYFAPQPETGLAKLGARWLGRDARTGEKLRQPPIAGVDRESFEALTAEPRRYGFHATMKAPFRLAEGFGERDLLAAVDSFAETAAPVMLDRIAISRIGRFLALTPVRPQACLGRFATSVVKTFDAFRAPLSPVELERRRRSRLTPAQDELLALWGYPYVMDEFRFHLTLTDAGDPAVLDLIEPAARVFFADPLENPLAIEAIALLVEPAPGEPFRLVADRPLKGLDGFVPAS